MKNSIKTLIILLLFISNLDAQHIRWHSDFDKAHQVALKEKKNLLVLLLESNKSQEILKSSFMNQNYIEEINNKFISVLVVKDQKSSYPIELLYTFEYPALFILDDNELFICKPMRGEISPNKLETYLKRCDKR